MKSSTEWADVYKDPTSSHYNVKIKRGEEGDVYDNALSSLTPSDGQRIRRRSLFVGVVGASAVVLIEGRSST